MEQRDLTRRDRKVTLTSHNSSVHAICRQGCPFVISNYLLSVCVSVCLSSNSSGWLAGWLAVCITTSLCVI